MRYANKINLPLVFVLALVALTLFACAQGAAPAQPTPTDAAPVDLTKIRYRADTPMSVLEDGRKLFVDKVRHVENIAWNQTIVSFVSDEAMIVWAIDQTKKAGLTSTEAEKVIRYFLAFRNDTYGADPCE